MRPIKEKKERALGMLECFEFFEPVIEDYVKLKSGKGEKLDMNDLRDLTAGLDDISHRMTSMQEQINHPK